MSRMSLGGMRNLGLEIVWEDPSFSWIFRLFQMEKFFPAMPDRVRRFKIKLIHLCYGLSHWGYFRFRKRLNANLGFRIENLRKGLGRIGGESETFILAFSSGGRISSLVADGFKIKRIICFGYPFRNPTEGENPDRYRHLADLKTPMLIIQGSQDEYGGHEAGLNIPLSASIELFFIDAEHDYRLDDHQWRAVMSKIESTLAPGFFPERRRHNIEGPWADRGLAP